MYAIHWCITVPTVTLPMYLRSPLQYMYMYIGIIRISPIQCCEHFNFCNRWLTYHSIIVLHLPHTCVVAVMYYIYSNKEVFIKTEIMYCYNEVLLLCPKIFLRKCFLCVHVCILLHVLVYIAYCYVSCWALVLVSL